MTQRCPNCNRTATGPVENRWHPFCCERCRLLDLGKWFDDSYNIAGEIESELPVSPDPDSPTRH